MTQLNLRNEKLEGVGAWRRTKNCTCNSSQILIWFIIKQSKPSFIQRFKVNIVLYTDLKYTQYCFINGFKVNAVLYSDLKVTQ